MGGGRASDRFDLNHNAVSDYDLVNGSLGGSWEGLDRSVVIANWNRVKAKASLNVFAGLEHPQVLAGYDGGDNFATWDAAAGGVPGVLGCMDTTGQGRDDDLERSARALTGGR